VTFKEKVEIAQSLVTIVAIVLGGGWALYQFFIRRAAETGLQIEVQPSTMLWNEILRYVFVDIAFKNTGQRRLDASADAAKTLETLHAGTVHYPVSLQIRRVVAPPSYVGHVDWWSNGANILSELVIPEVRLLTEYLDDQGKTGFFMEPGEEYHFGTALLLEKGAYMGKVVFVGSRGRAEYWSRIFAFAVE